MSREPLQPALSLPSDMERLDAARTGMSPALWAGRVPQEPALRSNAGDRTFAELNQNANRLARALRAQGLQAGDGVALLCGNRPEFAEAAAACQRSGLHYTPVNWHLTADEIAYIVDDSDAKAVIADARFAEVAAHATASARAVSIRLALGGAIPGFASSADALAAQPPEDLADPALGTRMLYTSGTTGRPKGVKRPPAYVVTRTPSLIAADYGPGKGQLHLCTGPLYHAAPLVFSLLLPLSEGVGVVLMERWDAEEALRLIERHRITHTHMVPTMFHRLLQLPEATRSRYDLSSLRYVIHGAAPCPVATKRAMIDWFGPIVWEYYAATEGSGATVSSEEWLKKPGTVGKPPDPDHVSILDEEGRPCPPNRPGTVYLKMLKGAEFEYHKDPDKTATGRRGEYYTLGDVGYLDRDGYLFLTDRSTDLIISGGVNIYPAEVEAVLLQHPAVRDAAVIGVPNEDWGEEVKAVLEINDSAAPGVTLESGIIAFCRERLAHFKCPRSVDFVDELPRRDNGKLYKHGLRERYRARLS